MPRSTSIVTACMNRQAHLLEAARRVTAWAHHQEHLIVDWSSEIPLRRCDLPADPRIRILRVSGEDRWNLCRAYNFALAHARGTCLFKLDADCWPEALDHPDVLAGATPLCRFGSGPDGRLGQWIIDRVLVEQVGGFNEFLWGYGFDDKDLKARLGCLLPLPLETLPEQAIGVIRHSIHYRAARRDGVETETPGLELRRSQALKSATSLANRVLAAHCPWHAGAAPSRYLLGEPDHWVAEPGSLPRPPAAVAREVNRLRRVVFWSRFMAIPEICVERLPEKLLPAGTLAAVPISWWHRAYWHTIRRLIELPVNILSSLRGSLQSTRRIRE
ncbi:glycosyltransferase family 2 protein [Synechococcus sp. CS-1329]|jgi:hypothetical protein|uniref:glycosyltransferase family 2 protein n=1 Tax=Synechococcus sp. CS-1329 TaxID=2847975 RepID=UPI00223BAB50|nr:glycosyltransferase family A protein [Synechococcus sp. CS-1329]MCT0219119.1 glycosyltransferase family 2 protein [Synechococcus sp. CS-1329]